MMHAAARSGTQRHAAAAAVTILELCNLQRRGCRGHEAALRQLWRRQRASSVPTGGGRAGGSADEPVVGGSATESAVVGVVVLWVVGVLQNGPPSILLWLHA